MPLFGCFEELIENMRYHLAKKWKKIQKKRGREYTVKNGLFSDYYNN